MLFNSWPFIFLTVATLFFFYLPPFRPYQIYILIISSVAFCAYRFPFFGSFILFSSMLCFCFNQAVTKNRNKKFWVLLGILINIVTLVLFKYANELPWSFTLESLAPFGISFFIFHCISLIVDTARGENAPDTDSPKGRLANTFLYLMFFPKLVAGPFIRPSDFFQQIAPKTWADVNIAFAARRLILGYFLKTVVADNLAEQTLLLANPIFKQHSTWTLLGTLFAYSCQVFADVAGYSFIAIGIAALFGYVLPENFRAPYIADSFSDFWRRWYTTFSLWLKEYIYLPLGGGRKGQKRVYLYLFVALLLAGLWHGARWNFVIWGIYHGLLLVVERMLRSLHSIRPPKALARISVFLAVSVGWTLFKLPRFSDNLELFQSIKNNWFMRPDFKILLTLTLLSLPVILYHAYHLYRTRILRLHFERVDACIYAVMLFLILTNGGRPLEFVYFHF